MVIAAETRESDEITVDQQAVALLALNPHAFAKGNVNEMTENAAADPSVLFLGLPDGTFVDRAKKAGIKPLLGVETQALDPSVRPDGRPRASGQSQLIIN